MENQEREISLGRLLWKLVFGWRSLLCCALILAVLAGGILYLKDSNNYKKAQNKQENGEELNYEFSELELLQIKDAEDLQELIDKNETYMEESPQMNINPYEENILILNYYVDSNYQFNYTEENSNDYTYNVVASYLADINNKDLSQRIVDDLKLSTEEKYVQELLSVISSENNAIFSVQVIYPDKDALPVISEIIKEEVNKKTAGISEKVGSHTLKLLSENITVRTDLSLAAVQKTNFDSLSSYRTQLNTLKTAMNEQQLEKLENEENAKKEETEPAEETVTIAKPKLQIKYILLGFVLGIFLAAMWIICKMLFAGKLQDSEELIEVFHLRGFGVLPIPQKISGIDKLLVKIKNRNKKQMTLEQSLDIISSNIELYCKAENIHQLYLTGTEIENISKELIQPVIKRLEQAGITVIYGENICYDAAALRKLVEVVNVVMIEQAEMSKYKEIEKEIRVISQQNAKILGCVGIEGVR